MSGAFRTGPEVRTTTPNALGGIARAPNRDCANTKSGPCRKPSELLGNRVGTLWKPRRHGPGTESESVFDPWRRECFCVCVVRKGESVRFALADLLLPVWFPAKHVSVAVASDKIHKVRTVHNACRLVRSSPSACLGEVRRLRVVLLSLDVLGDRAHET